jgi:hypothetical protein
MITFGNPAAVKFYPAEKFMEIRAAKPVDQKPLLVRLQEQVQHVSQATVCLSGGIDSQFMLRFACSLGTPVRAVTYMGTWDGSVINSDDVMHAQISAQQHSVPLDIIPIDLKWFFSSGLHIDYCKKYRLPSPQIAVHLHFLKLIKHYPGTFFLGGEIPLLCKNSDIQEGPYDVTGFNPSFLIRCAFSYLEVAKDLNIDLVKDIFMYTPEIIYQVLDENIQIVKTNQIHLEVPVNHTQMIYHNPVKFRLYERIIPGGIDTLLKANGFEKLKKYLACQSGIYNKFDLDYRQPMVDLYERNMKNVFDKTEGTVKISPAPLFKELSMRYRDSIEQSQSISCSQYYMDF